VSAITVKFALASKKCKSQSAFSTNRPILIIFKQDNNQATNNPSNEHILILYITHHDDNYTTTNPCYLYRYSNSKLYDRTAEEEHQKINTNEQQEAGSMGE
ncbi:MAG: hypothetical protein ACI8RD_013251, partial [Bacillariaceae sp.]|jgi:hypothetical protein